MIKQSSPIAVRSICSQSKEVILFLLIAFVMPGCATPEPGNTGNRWEVEPSVQTVENEYFSASLAPAAFDYHRNGYEAFDLSIKNKTAGTIELDWNNTVFIENNQSNGGFMYAGVMYTDRNNPKPPDSISAGSELKKTVWPNALVSFFSRWSHELIPPGQNGVYLTIKVQDKLIKEKIVLDMNRVPVPSR